MIKKFTQSITFFQEFFFAVFSINSQNAIEVLLMLASGHIFDIFTPNHLVQTLCIDKNKVYSAIKAWSVFLSKKLLFVTGCHIASILIKNAINKSPATLSRMRITICVDDTVVDRAGKLISLTYNWFSGKHKKTIHGQNIIAITIKIGKRIIPLNIRPVGKQGRGNTSKPDIFIDMLHEVLDFFKQKGINLTQFPITFDSWYGSKKLVDMLSEEKFTQILIHAKGNYVFNIDGKKQKLSAHKKDIQFQQSGWGCKEIPTVRKSAESPTFGKVLLLFFKDGDRINCIMVFGRKLRASEIMSIWKQHHSIECFWRRLKTDIQIHKVRMRDREGVYAMVGIKLVAYLLMEHLSSQTGLTFHQLKIQAKREIDICSFFSEHFHSLMVYKGL
jgi:hypothetical protein